MGHRKIDAKAKIPNHCVMQSMQMPDARMQKHPAILMNWFIDNLRVARVLITQFDAGNLEMTIETARRHVEHGKTSRAKPFWVNNPLLLDQIADNGGDVAGFDHCRCT
jgi:hypothetical protein